MSVTQEDQPLPRNSTRHGELDFTVARVELLCVIVVLALGFLQAFNARMQLGPDGIAYLDLGDLWLKGDFKNAINAYWNPVYPIVLSAACKLVDPINEPLATHMVNFGLLAVNLWLFKVLLRSVREFRERHTEGLNESEQLFVALGYLLFSWTHFSLIDLENISPDLVVMSCVIGAAILLLRMADREDWRRAAGLGALLAFGYLTKAIMFVAAPFFLTAALLCAPGQGKGFKHSLIAGFVFAILSAPYVAALTRQQGHVTYGESGKLAYVWLVNQVRPWFHWQGEEPGSGTPAHPTRQLLKNPDVYEFGDRLGTYPPWFDPTYWNKGLQVHIEPKKQLKAINQGLIEYYEIIFGQAASVGFLILFGIGVRRRSFRNQRELGRVLALLVPAVAVCGFYVLVSVMGRYVGPFILIAYLALLINCWAEVCRLLPRRALVVMVICAMTPIVFTIGGKTIKANVFKRTELTEQRRLVVALQEMGLQPGDRVAVLGRACNGYFARVGRFKIIAEGFREEDVAPLWALRPEFEMKAIEALKSTRPQAIIRDTPPQFESKLPWKVIPNTKFAALMLK